ncbi:amidohydrolase family protein, partial [Longimicrobium sp.]|uniref:amidohydrolase family protein n=1 Tax=Longimicrobium sp. TaxID=2029185 RepID=UPI002F935DF3
MIPRSRSTLLVVLLALSACVTAPRPAANPVPAPPRSPGWPKTGPGTPAERANAADMVLLGGRVFLADEANTVAEALAIRDGRVLAVGSDAAIREYAGAGTQIVDLDGKLVTPGFNDAHIHFGAGGQGLLNVSLLGTTSLAEIERHVAAAAAQAQPGEWILGRGWDHTRLPASELGAGGWPT